MTRKDYIAIAGALKSEKPNSLGPLTQWIIDVRAMAAVLHADNPRFDYDRFFVACGLTGEHV